MKFYKTEVKQTCNVMGGKEFFVTTEAADRMVLWKTVFLSDPLKMARASLCELSEAIAVDDIYSHDSDRHLKWQGYYMGTFVLTCEDAYRFMYMEDEKQTAFKRWMSFPVSPACNKLELGDVDEVPVKLAGVFDQWRRHGPEET